MHKILYLYAEVMGYTISTLQKLVAYGAEVHVVCWDDGKITPYELPDMANVYFYNRSQVTHQKVLNIAAKVSPDLVVVSGWQDRMYMNLCRGLVRQGLPVVCGFDDQWEGDFKQHLAAVLGKVGVFDIWYTHAWVCGPRQYEYARRLGFKKSRILFDLYSADVGIFNNSYVRSRKQKTVAYPHNFLFVGRFESVKGIDILIEAWEGLGALRKDWTLTLVGNGSLKAYYENIPEVKVLDFLQPRELVKLIESSGCFVLPSRFEPWGVVVHEFAAAGLPLILSDAVGASDIFLVNGVNGFIFQSKNAQSLKSVLLNIVESSDDTLLSMSELSTHFADRITPSTSAQNLLSLCQK